MSNFYSQNIYSNIPIRNSLINRNIYLDSNTNLSNTNQSNSPQNKINGIIASSNFSSKLNNPPAQNSNTSLNTKVYSNNSNISFYSNLLNKFETHIMSDNQKNAFTAYMKANCESNFTRDMLFFIEDYNSMINQSIQAIKSLLAENERLGKLLKSFSVYNLKQENKQDIVQERENNNNSKYNRNSNSNLENCNNIEYNIYNSNNNTGLKDMNGNDVVNMEEIINFKNEYNVKRPLREKIKKLSIENKEEKKLRNNSTFCSKRKIPLNISLNEEDNNIELNTNNINMNNIDDKCINDKALNNRNYRHKSVYFNEKENLTDRNRNPVVKFEELNSLKITNEILRLIEVTQKNKKLFIQKYLKSNNSNLDENYKIFLQNIIEYKYNYNILNNILSDILLLKNKGTGNKNLFRGKYDKTTLNSNISNCNNVSQVTCNPRITDKNFKDNLRKYNCGNQNFKKKPFVQFTNPYGKLFSREVGENN